MADGRVWKWLLPIAYFCPLVALIPLERSLEINPEENIGVDEYLSEGDIRVSRRRDAVRDYYQTWINRTVPFTMEGLNESEQEYVYSAMDEISAASCVRFIQRTTQIDYITITKKDSCSSSVGRRGGQQQVTLGEGCYAKGIILHELMHALGFWHEHSRPDRDSFIVIVWDNIASEHRSNFEKYDSFTINTLETTYDYGSIMHYKNNTFALDRSTITINATHPLPLGVQMGQRVALSDTDKVKINRLYRCNITHCPDPGVPKNGVRKGENFQVGSSVYYSCNKGYLLFGSRGRICPDVGQWTGDLPSCLPSYSLDPVEYCNYDDQTVCGWMQDRTAQRNWTINSRSTPSNGTGPMEDHTMGSAEGWYIYLETSAPTRQGDIARLISPEFRVTTTTCMMFFYCMHGEEMGTLNIYQQTTTGQQLETLRSLLFTMTGDQGSDWRLAAITLPDAQSFVIIIEAVAGNSYMSDIAVDDVVIGPCSNLAQLSSDTVADTLQCSFDSGTCDWTQDYVTDVFDWTLHSGSTDTFYTGPTCDPVNCATGQYLYIEASRPRLEGDTARILTPLLHGDGWRCLLFYYSMYGQDMGSPQYPCSTSQRHGTPSMVTLW
ncbi:uncharacterized protein LOC112558985 isoform X1 [Pomacea canaliculata]|uniref:uncharacterized protein LOC112558985 isoform X1 n=1 Tax=Pomacea canaliculata TaxID=400727 RepID=UPI000D73DCF8|nr:uncharacterized protein LOC112558985 isoform X1 [Pomacea canaliculata]